MTLPNKSDLQPQSTEGWLETAKREWAALTSIAAFALSVAGGFVLLPPEIVEEKASWEALAAFILAVCAGLVLVLGRGHFGQAYTGRWGATSAVSLVITLALLLFYLGEHSRLSEHLPDGSVVVVGDEYTLWAQQRMKEEHDRGRSLTNAEFIWAAAGVERVYSKPDIVKNKIWLGALYLTCVTGVLLTVMTLVQAIRCGRSRAS